MGSPSESSRVGASSVSGKVIRILALAGCMVALLSALACTSAQQPATPAASSEDQPRSGGVLKVHVIHTTPDTLDPLKEGAIAGTAAVAPAYSQLVRFDPAKSIDTTVIAPDLAERWETSGDGKTVTFSLRKDAKWQDGTPFTAADVKYSFDRYLDPKDPRSVDFESKRRWTRAMDRVEIADDHTVRLLLKAPSASILSMLGQGPLMIAPKHAYEKTIDPTHEVMGIGPFRVKNYQAGVSIEYERNPAYFEKGLPYLDGIIMYWLKDDATRTAALVTKQLDLLRNIERRMWEEIRRDDPEAKLVQWNQLQDLFVGVNVSRPPFSDPRVRKAIFLGLDRRAGNELLAGDWGTLGGFIYPGPWALSKEELSKMPGYGDPQAHIAEAKKLLAEAGYPQGFKTNMITSNNPSIYEETAVWAKDQLKKNLNIDATLEVTKDAGVRRIQGNFDMIANKGGEFVPDPGAANYWGPGNWMRFEDQEIFDLLTRQDRTLDPAERKKLVNEMERKLLERGPYTVITWPLLGSARQPWVRNHFEPTCTLCNFQYAETWLAK